jgi:hypothetical protein
MSDIYTHIGFAISNAKLVILLSAKPLAIDQIQIVKDRIEVTIIRINYDIHLWGAEVILPDFSEKVVGPKNIKIQSKSEVEYLLTLDKKCIGAKLYSTKTKPKYGADTFYV